MERCHKQDTKKTRAQREAQVRRPGAKTIKKNTNSTQNKSQTHRAKQYEVTSFLSTDCELSTETCSKNVYSLGPLDNENLRRQLEIGKRPTKKDAKGLGTRDACWFRCSVSILWLNLFERKHKHRPVTGLLGGMSASSGHC